jgi:hypothetical protein
MAPGTMGSSISINPRAVEKPETSDEEAAITENSVIGMGVEVHRGLRQMWGLGS